MSEEIGEVVRGRGRPAILDMGKIAEVWNSSPTVMMAADSLGMSLTQLHAAVYRGRRAGISFKSFRRSRRGVVM